MTAPHSNAPQRRFALANLIAQVGIIVTGGLVRVTGSGLGCSTWPMCEPGAFTPTFHEASSWHPFIEFGNRTLTGVLTIIAIGLIVVLKRKSAPARPDVLPYAWGVLALIAVQAVVGGISVWVTLHPAVVGLHMVLSLGLVALSTFIVYRIYRPHPGVESPSARRASTLDRVVHGGLALWTVVVALLGVVVTGTGPHSGDATRPYRFAIDPLVITRTHAIAAWVLLALVALSFYLASRAPLQVRRAWLLVVAVLIIQGVIGYVQYFTGLVPPLVILHMLGSGLVVVAITWAIATVYARPASSEVYAPSEQAARA
ncbi:MAG: COX15/CtaA family protein [Bowdeniella nasicola]|nr:COX15/CtaA family protein [Bowdeniella nasicola]